MKRYIVTESIVINGKRVPVRGYWQGPDKKSLLTQHARIRKDIMNSMVRIKEGCYGWHPLAHKFLPMFAG